MFGSLFEKPKMVQRLLEKPPFKYILDIIAETTKVTGKLVFVLFKKTQIDFRLCKGTLYHWGIRWQLLWQQGQETFISSEDYKCNQNDVEDGHCCQSYQNIGRPRTWKHKSDASSHLQGCC